MLVVVTSKVQKAGSAFNGDVLKLVVVETEPGYSPNSGGVGKGKLIATVCGPS
jgi:hypothetical protein